jgi:long-subunit acyl-CoA synthetase (AMP-forming)
MIVNEFLQSVIIGQEDELVVEGTDVFAGYLGRDDLTKKTLIEIDDELYYRTDDIVRMDNNALL